MQHLIDEHTPPEAPTADPDFLHVVRRASLGKVRAIEQMTATTSSDDMKRFLEAFRRAELQVVSECDKRIYGKKKPRRSKK